MLLKSPCLLLTILFIGSASADKSARPSFSGIYPHLAFFNNENECGTGAVVPWADRLWAVTYAPHRPEGSSDKLYEIDKDLNMTVRDESIGGTPANRMIHRESNQLFIGPYAIDAQRGVRAIPYTEMFGRPTGNARHLTDPANKIYYATMEEGIYEVEVSSLKVTTHFHDEAATGEPKADLPGYHGKGLYSGHARLVYANNGEHGSAALKDPFVDSGVLAQWGGMPESRWEIVRRNQFTEVTGPGGIYGNVIPNEDPIWAMGWDAKSLLLMCLDEGEWHHYRLPKASHSYDGAHGWNTEWPRIREIGEGDDFLMTMHGMFWNFPKTFSAKNTAGISPRSSYLKVVGDFARWGDDVVLGCDDTARSEFLNKRRAKGEVAAPQSQSNLWFVKPEQLDHFGPVLGRGAVWLDERVTANEPSDAFLFSGFASRSAHLFASENATFIFEIDVRGDGHWATLSEQQARGYTWIQFPQDVVGSWIRVRSSTDLAAATAWFTFAGDDHRAVTDKFTGIAQAGDQQLTGGILRARDENKRNLHFAADTGLYHLDADMKLRAVDNPDELTWLRKHAAIPDRRGVLEVDAASVVYIDDSGRRFRLPKGDPSFDQAGPLGWGRLCREVATERDLFNCHGTFYELPAENAAGFARVRPISTHNLRLSDYCSYRGLMVISGINKDAAKGNPHIIQSEDGQTALWAGAIDDIWELGKPVGSGGPWLDTAVRSGETSDPYLMTGYDKKVLTLSAKNPTTVTVEVDITGNADWHTYKTIALSGSASHEFPDGFQAYWVRFASSEDNVMTAQLRYD